MKLFNSNPSANSIFGHYAPLLKFLKPAALIFVGLSATTVFYGLIGGENSFLNGFIVSIFPGAILVGRSIGFSLFALFPDLLNITLVAFVTRGVWKAAKGAQGYRTYTHFIILALCAFLSFVLTRYSFKTARESGKIVSTYIAGEAKLLKTDSIDAIYKPRVLALDMEFDSIYNKRAVNIDKSIESKSNSIKSLNRSIGKDNYSLVQSQISLLNDQISDLNKSKDDIYKEVQADKEKKKQDIEKEYRAALSPIVEKNKKNEQEHKGTSTLMISEMKNILGWAIIIALIVKIAIVLIMLENGIEPVAKINEADFQFSHIVEVVTIIKNWIGFRILNWFRSWYIPNLEQPHNFGRVYDYKKLKDESEKHDKETDRSIYNGSMSKEVLENFSEALVETQTTTKRGRPRKQ